MWQYLKLLPWSLAAVLLSGSDYQQESPPLSPGIDMATAPDAAAFRAVLKVVGYDGSQSAWKRSDILQLLTHSRGPLHAFRSKDDPSQPLDLVTGSLMIALRALHAKQPEVFGKLTPP